MTQILVIIDYHMWTEVQFAWRIVRTMDLHNLIFCELVKIADKIMDVFNDDRIMLCICTWVHSIVVVYQHELRENRKKVSEDLFCKEK